MKGGEEAGYPKIPIVPSGGRVKERPMSLEKVSTDEGIRKTVRLESDAV